MREASDRGQAGPGIADEPDRRESAAIELPGSIAAPAPPPPPIEELRKIAMSDRPDALSFRLGVTRAHADVRLARANAYSDVYVLWQPYTFQDNSPFGLKSATSWALGVTVPLPIYNRNQGGIERAKINVTQSQVQLSDVERQILMDVEKAVQEYEVSKGLVQESERRGGPRSLAGARRSLANVDGGRDQLVELPPGPARLQRRREAISRHRDPAQVERALAQYHGGSQDHALIAARPRTQGGEDGSSHHPRPTADRGTMRTARCSPRSRISWRPTAWLRRRLARAHGPRGQ